MGFLKKLKDTAEKGVEKGRQQDAVGEIRDHQDDDGSAHDVAEQPK